MDERTSLSLLQNQLVYLSSLLSLDRLFITLCVTIRTTPMRDAGAFSAPGPSRTIFRSFLPFFEEKQPKFAVVIVSETGIPPSSAAKGARSYVTCIKIAVLETKNSKITTFFTFLAY